jgi:hypothetical protein
VQVQLIFWDEFLTSIRHLQVMEQFFSLVNTFLQNHRDTSERRLRIRTYKVAVNAINLIHSSISGS